MRIDGDVNDKDRATAVEKFEQGRATFMLLSLKAGGVGLNLRTANYVILLDPWCVVPPLRFRVCCVS